MSSHAIRDRRRTFSAAGLPSLLVLVAAGSVDCGSDKTDESAPTSLLDAGPRAQDGDPGDGALPDGFTPTRMIVDFGSTSAAFPPTVNKIGFNSFWNSASNDGDFDAWTIRRGAAYRAPMIAGLIEPKSLVNVAGYKDHYEEYDARPSAADLDAQKCSLWEQKTGYTNTLFHSAGGKVQARVPTDADLSALRAAADASGLINFLQVSGTPGTILPVATTLDNGLFTLNGTPTTDGNWYPLPPNADFPALAYAFGTLPNALGYGTRTIYAFWQEPTHTISESITARTSLDKYTNLYWQIASEIATQCRFQSCPMAGAQLNANDGDSAPHDGSRYKWFMDALRGYRAAHPGAAIPLDYFTIQNYSAQWNDNILANSRVALGTDSSWTPVLMNEWDYCVNVRAGDGCGPELSDFTSRYDGPASWNALRWLRDSIERPDVSHVLLREKVMQDRDPKTSSYSYPWTQIPILFLASMSELRRPTSYAIPDLPVIASGDDDQIRILAWNEGATSKKLTLSLTHLPATLLGQTLYVKRISKKIRDARCPGAADVMDANHAITCWDDAIAPAVISAAALDTAEITVAEGEATMIFAGSPPKYSSSLFANNFVRSYQHVRRDGTAAAPKGMGHYDPRTGSITVGVQSGGSGVARMLLTNAPASVVVSTRFAAQGGLRAEAAVAGVRVDYLDASRASIKSVFFRDDRWPTSAAPWAELDWPLSAAHANVSTNLCGAGCVNGSGAAVSIDIQGNAPPGWSATKEIDVGVVLAGSDGDAIYRVDFP